jgi:hypothetical protein
MLRLLEIGLEELGGIRQELLDAVLRSLGDLDVLRRGDAGLAGSA